MNEGFGFTGLVNSCFALAVSHPRTAACLLNEAGERVSAISL